eukprot:623826-Prorocentrum_minimum.AAC.1
MQPNLRFEWAGGRVQPKPTGTSKTSVEMPVTVTVAVSSPPPHPLLTRSMCGTWISPRNQYVAHGACSWEFWMFTTL